MDHISARLRLIVATSLVALAPIARPGRADEATDQYNVASGFFNMNRFDFAAEEYDKFLRTYPKHVQVPEALFFLGESYYQLNRTEDARNAFRDVVAKYPKAKNQSYALYRLGETSYLLGDYKTAEPALAEFVAKRPDDPLIEYALPDLGRTQLLAGKLPEAKATLAKSLEKFPKGRLADRSKYDLAQTLERLNEVDAALVLYRDVAADADSKLADDAQLAIGIRMFETKNYEAAIQAFQQLEQRFPTSNLVQTAKLNRALCLYQMRRFDQAATMLAEQVQGDAVQVPETWYWLGMSQKGQGQAAAAAKTLLDGYAKFPASSVAPDMLFYAAQVLFQQGQVEPASQRWRELIGKFPKHALVSDSLYYAAECARTSGQHDLVFQLAERLYKDFPDSPWVERMALTVAQSLIAAGRHDEAVQQLRDLLDRQPGPVVTASAQYYRAVALHEASKVDEALAALQELSAEPSDDPALVRVRADAQFLTGSCYFEKKEYERAVAPLQKYLAMRPDGEVVAHALSYLAVSQAGLGRFDELRGTLDALRAKAPPELLLPTIHQVAEVCFDAKQFARASELFAEVAQKDPQGRFHAKGLSGLGWSRFQEGKFAAAAGAFGQVVESHADDPLAGEAAYMRGRSLESDAKLADAVAAYRLVLAKYAQSPPAFEAGLQLARTLQRSGKPQDAIAVYEDLTKRFPKSPGLDTVLNEWAWVHVLEHQEAEARKILERLKTEFPQSPLVSETTLNIAEAEFQSQRFADVVARLKPLLEQKLAPKVRESALYRLGRTQVELAAWADAKSSFDRLTQEFPETKLRREAEFWMAESEREQGQPKAAAERLAKLVAAPVEPEPWLGTAWLRLAQCQGEQKQWKETLATIEQLKGRFPKYELLNVADYHAGRALQNLARFDEARDAYRRAIGPRSDDTAAQSQFMIGETFFHQRKFQEALREYLKVEILYAFPQWQAAALLEAAKCQESLQQWSRAAETYNRILEKYAKTTHAAEAAQRLPEAQKKAANTSNGKRSS